MKEELVSYEWGDWFDPHWHLDPDPLMTEALKGNPTFSCSSILSGICSSKLLPLGSEDWKPWPQAVGSYLPFPGLRSNVFLYCGTVDTLISAVQQKSELRSCWEPLVSSRALTPTWKLTFQRVPVFSVRTQERGQVDTHQEVHCCRHLSSRWLALNTSLRGPSCLIDLSSSSQYLIVTMFAQDIEERTKRDTLVPGPARPSAISSLQTWGLMCWYRHTAPKCPVTLWFSGHSMTSSNGSGCPPYRRMPRNLPEPGQPTLGIPHWPSVQAFILHWHRTRLQACSNLHERDYAVTAICCTPAPTYHVGQKLWLFIWDARKYRTVVHWRIDDPEGL